MTAPEKSWLLSFWVLFVLGYILICAHITPDDVIVLVASAHLSGLNSICKCSLLSLYKYSLMARSDEAVEFSLGSLLTQTTALCPTEGILCLSNRNKTGTGSHFKSLEETRLSLNEIRRRCARCSLQGKHVPGNERADRGGPRRSHLLHHGNFPKCSGDR